MTEQEPVREQVQIPEAEANELVKRLRHSKLVGVGLSVYAYVSKNGTRALHVAADLATGNGDYQRYDIQYKADTDMDKLERNALKRIRTEFHM